MTGGAYREKNAERLALSDGDRDRASETRAGAGKLRIPKPRKGSDFPGFLELCRISETALTAGIQEA
ncbi:transposase [Bradyrhizobium sp. CCGB12]|uniref:transposase n=1 Tax=Bradyrhizobium sp. CCGB12 TaxID=2949632 RepID=UPI0020B3A2D4|nr:transposase [Bradyrhizobium sp. CCGB12]MCP3392065.1 transposase [Bradyrhizobium sp. CCGB12]